MAIRDRFKKAFNAFRISETVENRFDVPVGPSTTYRPDKQRLRFYNDRSLISSIFTRISIDVAAIDIRHVKVNENDQYLEDMESALNDCLKLEPNLDQGPRAFRQDFVMTLFDRGVAAIVPVDTAENPLRQDQVDIYTLRVGEIINWYPKHVRVSCYNENKGLREEILIEKRRVAIVENPLYAVMNEPNSTLQRLIRKLNLLDTVDEQSGSGKLDIIIQLPYVIKSEARRQQAEQRRQDIEFQLKGSQYGIAYTDGTEKITQLNRPAENNLFKQVEYLTKMLYAQLGITESVMDGTADEKTMTNYFNRTVEPIVESFTEAAQRSFLGHTGTKAQERIMYFYNPFKGVPLTDLAEIADVVSRNEILAPNELRAAMGLPPSTDPKADELHNSNMPQPDVVEAAPPGPSMEDMDKLMNEVFDGLTKDIESITAGSGTEDADGED